MSFPLFGVFFCDAPDLVAVYSVVCLMWRVRPHTHVDIEMIRCVSIYKHTLVNLLVIVYMNWNSRYMFNNLNYLLIVLYYFSGVSLPTLRYTPRCCRVLILANYYMKGPEYS